MFHKMFYAYANTQSWVPRIGAQRQLKKSL